MPRDSEPLKRNVNVNGVADVIACDMNREKGKCDVDPYGMCPGNGYHGEPNILYKSWFDFRDLS